MQRVLTGALRNFNDHTAAMSRGKEKSAASKEKFENTALNYMASNDLMVHKELARIWSDAVSIFTYEVKNTKIRMFGARVKIRTAQLM